MVEIAVFHVRDVAARSHAPLAHAVGAFARVVFNGSWCPAVRVAFTQDGVYSATLTFGIARAYGFVFVGFGIFWKVWKLVAFAL